MNSLHIITPVKDSIDTTLDTVKAIMESEIRVPYTYTIYNDFSTPENTLRLEEASQIYGFRLINLSDLTDHPSPNYLLVLQKTQQEAIEANAGLLIVESDVTVEKNTLQALFDGAMERKNCGMAASVTVDSNGEINFPYLYAKGRKPKVYDEKKRFSFCCTLLTPQFLKAFDFHLLDASKNWFDVTISHESIRKGFHNYLFVNLPVLHRPHGSRPWKQLKYTNPLKYYWLKFTKGLDKI
ncbi:MAG: glycosyltransferase family 2 protein [Bacteroidaceae bacterium]|nr:glycosyltransferase family 2 protein [Bacteroidaceae bacterium]